MGGKKKIKKIKRAKKQKKVVIKKSVGQNTLKVCDEKIQIKKIKKQPNEKKIYNIKDYVVSVSYTHLTLPTNREV